MTTTMRHSESIAKLAAALVKAQAEVENATKNATNLHLGNKYADLGEVLRVVKPALAAHGIAVVQAPGFQGDVVTLETMLLHESGEWISGVAGAPLPIGRVNKKGEPLPLGAQDVGSAITYLRRYGLAAFASITQEDDDGQAVGNNTSGARISDKQAGEIKSLLKQTSANVGKFLAYMKVSEVEGIPASDYEKAKAALARKQSENGQKAAAGAR